MAVELGGATMEVLNPASGDVIAMVPRCAASDVEHAVAAAAQALPGISEAQRERVLGFVDRAASAGARVLTGGNAGRGPGFFVEPTVITGVGQDDEIVQHEVFGPVVTVQRASSDAEAVTLANDVAYGLASSVWTNDVRKALNIARELEYGTVWINDHLPMASEMPAGGYKESGYGKDMGVQALEAYTQVKHVMAKL